MSEETEPKPESSLRMSRRGESRVRKPIGHSALTGSLVDKPEKTDVIVHPMSSRVKRPRITPETTGQVLSARGLPSFEAVRPAPEAVKIYKDTERGIDLRLSPTKDHEDGVAYNPATETVVLCDGMGAVGSKGEVRSNLAFALSHAVALMSDISQLQDPDAVKAVFSAAKDILNSVGIDVAAPADKRVSNWHPVEWGSTVAAVQRVPETNRWRIATLGDSSVAILGADGRIRDGFGEAFQALKAGDVGHDGTAQEAPLGSLVGFAKGSLDGFARYENGARRGHAEFTEVELGLGEKLVIASDAYIQKSHPYVLEQDAALTPEQWAAKAPIYGDDTTMAVIAPVLHA